MKHIFLNWNEVKNFVNFALGETRKKKRNQLQFVKRECTNDFNSHTILVKQKRCIFNFRADIYIWSRNSFSELKNWLSIRRSKIVCQRKRKRCNSGGEARGETRTRVRKRLPRLGRSSGESPLPADGVLRRTHTPLTAARLRLRTEHDYIIVYVARSNTGVMTIHTRLMPLTQFPAGSAGFNPVAFLTSQLAVYTSLPRCFVGCSLLL